MPVRIFESFHQHFAEPHGLGIIAMPFTAKQSLNANSDGSAVSLAFGGGTRVIVVQSDERVTITIGAVGVANALADDFQIPAGGQMPLLVTPGHVLKARLL